MNGEPLEERIISFLLSSKGDPDRAGEVEDAVMATSSKS